MGAMTTRACKNKQEREQYCAVVRIDWERTKHITSHIIICLFLYYVIWEKRRCMRKQNTKTYVF